MKKNLYLFFAIILYASYSVIGQEAKKYVLFEHYTNTGCGPCATQNPVFKQFYDANTDRAHHIAFHPWWPSSADPMYKYNVAENTSMTQYYAVDAVPAMFANGVSIGSPVNANVGVLDAAGTSPIKIRVSQNKTSDSMFVSVKLITKSTIDTGNFILRVAVIEKLVLFSGAPNGEKEFPNVFRKFIENEFPVSFKVTDDEQVFNFKFALDKTNWVEDQIYTLAYVVNTANKQILNSATPYDSDLEILSSNTLKGDAESLSYEFFVDNYSNKNETFNFLVSGDYPTEWTYHIMKSDSVFKPGRSKFEVIVNPNGVGGVGRFNVVLTSTDSSQIVLKSGFTAINNLRTLVLTRSQPSPTSVDITTPYLNGLKDAESKDYGYLNYDEFIKAHDLNLLKNTKDIFCSVGWFFPAFTDEVVSRLKDFLDNGGNLMVTGQDVAWDVLSGDASSNGTQLQKDFMTNYLKTKFLNDGSTASTSFTITKTDPLFGNVANSNINKVYGATYLYPEQIEPLDSTGHIFLRYKNNNASGAYWLKDKNYKVVYMGIGPEQITTVDVANAIIKTAKDWFDGIISSTEFESKLNGAVLGNATPNPANNSLIIPIYNENTKPFNFKLLNSKGEIVFEKLLKNSFENVEINTSELTNGLYFYSINDGNKILTKKVAIQH
jgi:hypothetical protein